MAKKKPTEQVTLDKQKLERLVLEINQRTFEILCAVYKAERERKENFKVIKIHQEATNNEQRANPKQNG